MLDYAQNFYQTLDKVNLFLTIFFLKDLTDNINLNDSR